MDQNIYLQSMKSRPLLFVNALSVIQGRLIDIQAYFETNYFFK